MRQFANIANLMSVHANLTLQGCTHACHNARAWQIDYGEQAHMANWHMGKRFVAKRRIPV